MSNLPRQRPYDLKRLMRFWLRQADIHLRVFASPREQFFLVGRSRRDGKAQHPVAHRHQSFGGAADGLAQGGVVHV